MAIAVSDIVVDLKAALDAEGSDRYTFNQDYLPAINRAVDFIVSVFNKAFADNKLSEENLRELIEIKIYQLSSTSTLTFTSDELTVIWSIFAIYPFPRTFPATITPLASSASSAEFITGTPPNTSPTYSFLGGDKSAKRKTLEQWVDAEANPFEKGNTSITATDLVEYAFLSFSNQNGTNIIIRPGIANEPCAVAFLNNPTPVESDGDEVQFPQALKNMLVSKALMYIAQKQGDNTTLFSVTDKDVKELIVLLN
jgi:hypothetical protein